MRSSQANSHAKLISTIKAAINSPLLDQLRQAAAEKDLAHRARRLSAALIRKFQIIPHGVDLVCWIADTSCANNGEAIEQWTTTQLEDCSFSAELQHRSEIEVLVSRFSRRMASVEDSVT